MPLPLPADDAPTQQAVEQDDASDSKSTKANFASDEARTAVHHERKAASDVVSGRSATESSSALTTEAPAAKRTGTPLQQELSALLALRSANDKAIDAAFLQLDAEADAAPGSSPTEDPSPKMSEGNTNINRAGKSKCVRVPYQACAELPRTEFLDAALDSATKHDPTPNRGHPGRPLHQDDGSR